MQKLFGVALVIHLAALTLSAKEPLKLDINLISQGARDRVDWEEIQASSSRFLAAESAQEAGQLCLKLFPSRHARSVDMLIASDNSHLSIQAAWRRYSRMVPRRGFQPGFNDKEIDIRDAERFLGFLEGRIQILVPRWWEQCLIDPAQAELNTEDLLQNKLEDLSELIDSPIEDPVVIKSSRGRLLVPAKSLDWVASHPYREKIAMTIDGRHAVLLNYNESAAQMHLVCVDIVEPKELWRNVVWGNSVGQYSGPPIHHRMSIEMNRDRVVVFGALNRGIGMYFEAFSRKEGATIARFSTTNWRVDDASQDK